jgi:radical SAM protein with 4Fe4S-binding SPASM domain
MACSTITKIPYQEFSSSFHKKAVSARIPLNGTLELTHRCNLNCIHCYCNLPLDSSESRKQELSTLEVLEIIDQTVDQGCLWLLLTGGECLVRKDFFDIWRYAKKKGLLLTLFTNGTLISPATADLLHEFPPFSVEITLYGAGSETYEKITGVPGSYDKCLRGINLLVERNIPLKLKTMVLKENIHELEAMEQYARGLGVDFRFDPMINARLDNDTAPSQHRIAPEEVVRLNMEDDKRLKALKEFCNKYFNISREYKKLFTCGAGVTSFAINPYGKLQGCGMVTEPSANLKEESFRTGWKSLFHKICQRQASANYTCKSCELYELCSICPGWSLAEHNNLEAPVAYLCEVTRGLAQGLKIGGYDGLH